MGHLAIARAARAELVGRCCSASRAAVKKTREITRRSTGWRCCDWRSVGRRVWDRASNCGGPTYTADTLDALAGERLDDEFWFIGRGRSGGLAELEGSGRIVKHATIAVASETAPTLKGDRGRAGAFGAHRAFRDAGNRYVLDRSAGMREHRQSIEELVPAPVAKYITAKGCTAPRTRTLNLGMLCRSRH
jgi:nicotinic acid mononucleotide adenylyltransferase